MASRSYTSTLLFILADKCRANYNKYQLERARTGPTFTTAQPIGHQPPPPAFPLTFFRANTFPSHARTALSPALPQTTGGTVHFVFLIAAKYE